MSSGAECEYLEFEPGQWYLFLENQDVKERWDWREWAACHGPFPTSELTDAYVRRYHTNPGGATILDYDPKRSQDSELSKWIANAEPLDAEQLADLQEWLVLESRPYEVKEAERLQRIAEQKSLQEMGERIIRQRIHRGYR